MRKKLLIGFVVILYLVFVLIIDNHITDSNSLSKSDTKFDTAIESDTTKKSSYDQIMNMFSIPQNPNDNAYKIPVACTFEYKKNEEFESYLSVTIINNTDEVIKSVYLMITKIGSSKVIEKKMRIIINPGKQKTVDFENMKFVSKVWVSEYFGSRSGAILNIY